MSSAAAASPSRTVFVAGGTSQTGSATIRALLSSYPHVRIVAGVRSSKKAAEAFPNADAKRLTFVEHNVVDGRINPPAAAKDAKDAKDAKAAPAAAAKDAKAVSKSDPGVADLVGADALLLVAPQAYGDRVGHTTAYINAARAAGIKHIVFVSSPAAKTPTLLLGAGLHASEALLKASGLPVTNLHLLMFFENHYGNAATIKSQSAFYYPAKADVPVPALSVADIAAATARVVADGPALHGGRTYTLAGPSLSWDGVAAVFSRVLGKPVKFVSVSDEAAVKAMTGLGWPESSARGMAELFREFDKGHPYSDNELALLLGRNPQSFEQWLTPVASAFK